MKPPMITPKNKIGGIVVVSLKTTKFSDSLRQQAARGLTPVIPDIKCVSPQAGELLQGRSPITMAKLFLEADAPALSVVTEPQQFGGSLRLLEQVAAFTSRPILRKDFIRDRQQLIDTVQAGASAVLLIVAILEELSLIHISLILTTVSTTLFIC